MAHEVFKSLPAGIWNHEVDDIAGHQHDVECSIKVNHTDIALDPRCRGAPISGRHQHLSIDVDSCDIDTSAVKLPADPTRAASCVEHASWREAGDKIGLPMHVLAGRRSQLVRALVPIPSTQARPHPLIFARAGGRGVGTLVLGLSLRLLAVEVQLR